MKAKMIFKINTILEKVFDYLDGSKTRRIITGTAIALGAFVYTFFLVGLDGDGNAYGLLAHIISTVVFGFGLSIISKDTEAVKKVIEKISIEAGFLMTFLLSSLEIAYAIKCGYGNLNHFHLIMLFGALVFFAWYIIRFILFIADMLKKITTVLKTKDIKERTGDLNDIMKNIISIIGLIVSGLAVMFQFFSPIIKEFISYLH